MEIQITNLRKQFDQHILFDHLSHTFNTGITCITGHSGCGKTTLLRIIMELEHADAGSIRGTEGVKFGAVFQEDRLFDNLSCLRNVQLTASKTYDKQRIIELLESIGISDPYQKAGSLSGGMHRRVAFARAIAAPHDVLILDEPFTGIDQSTKEELFTHIRAEGQHRIVILVTHNKKDADDLGAEILNIPGITT